MNLLNFFTFIAIFIIQAALAAPAALSELQQSNLNVTENVELQPRSHNDDCVEWEDEDGIWPW